MLNLKNPLYVILPVSAEVPQVSYNISELAVFNSVLQHKRGRNNSQLGRAFRLGFS